MNFESKISVNFIKPVPLPVIAANIPEELRALPRWVLWKYEQVSPSAKWSKVPKTTKGYAAQSNNPATWTTFEEAHAAYQTGAFDGLGLVLAGQHQGAAEAQLGIFGALQAALGDALLDHGGTLDLQDEEVVALTN